MIIIQIYDEVTLAPPILHHRIPYIRKAAKA